MKRVVFLISLSLLAPNGFAAGPEPGSCSSVFLSDSVESKRLVDFDDVARRLTGELEAALSSKLISADQFREFGRVLGEWKGKPLKLTDMKDWSDTLLKAESRLPQMRSAIERMEAHETAYFVEIYQASLSAVLKHAQIILRDPGHHWDWSRYAQILSSISRFDSENAKFSFFKVKRSVEGRYSIREFIRCRM